MEVALTEQQRMAMERICRFIEDETGQVFILRGYAGTGKTTLIRSLVQKLSAEGVSITLMAPTGRAAKILEETCQAPAFTIHRTIYRFSGYRESKRDDDVPTICFDLADVLSSVVSIVDEASMVSAKKTAPEGVVFGSGNVMEDLLTVVHPDGRRKLIFVGDPAQLPPVGESQSMALDPSYFEKRKYKVEMYELTQVVRQVSDSLILDNASRIRELLRSPDSRYSFGMKEKPGEVEQVDPEEVVTTCAQSAGSPPAIICYSNSLVQRYNLRVRSVLFPGKSELQEGDRLMVVRNNYAEGEVLFNGDILTVLALSGDRWFISESVRKGEGTHPLTVRLRRATMRRVSDEAEVSRLIVENLLDEAGPQLSQDVNKVLYIDAVKRLHGEGIPKSHPDFAHRLLSDPIYGALQVRYGYAFTGHKAQGGEWDDVFVDFETKNNPDEESIRWWYTAVTRARERLRFAHFVNRSPLTGLTIRPITRTSSIPTVPVSSAAEPVTPYHDEHTLSSQRAKYRSVAAALRAKGCEIIGVRLLQWMDRYTIRDSAGTTCVVDAHYKKTGLFTSYDIRPESPTLRQVFETAPRERYSYEYSPSRPFLAALRETMEKRCAEAGIDIIGISENGSHYHVVYYLRSEGGGASITFSFNKSGRITTAAPLSQSGEEDTKLKELLALLS